MRKPDGMIAIGLGAGWLLMGTFNFVAGTTYEMNPKSKKIILEESANAEKDIQDHKNISWVEAQALLERDRHEKDAAKGSYAMLAGLAILGAGLIMRKNQKKDGLKP